MLENDFLVHIRKKLIVSCQALPEEPLYSSFIMSKMAKAAEEAGASAIRANTVEDIEKIKSETSLPIIGLIKQDYEDSSVYITPTMTEVRAVCQTGIAVVAMDATSRVRPNNEKLVDIVKQAKLEFPNTLMMADTATVADVICAKEIGFDVIGTTLYGYTEDTKGLNIADNDFEHLKNVLQVTNLPVIAEGKVDTPEKAKRVLEIGAYSVVTGGAITRPQEIARKFVNEIAKVK